MYDIIKDTKKLVVEYISTKCGDYLAEAKLNLAEMTSAELAEMTSEELALINA